MSEFDSIQGPPTQPRPRIEELWERSDLITKKIIEKPRENPAAFAQMVWSGDYVPQFLQRCYEVMGRLRPW